MKAVFAAFLILATGLGLASARASAPNDSKASLAPPQNMETCFSPEEKCDERLIAFLGTANHTDDVTLYNLTHRGIAKALEDARARVVKVRVVADQGQAEFKPSLVAQLNNEGFSFVFATKLADYSLMHDKFTIVDGRMLETGSYNYTMAATKNNHENQLYVDVASVVARYQQNFDKMFAEGTPMPAGFKNEKSYSDCPAATPTPAPSPAPF